MLAKYVNGLCGQEGERHSVTFGRRFMMVTESDYREDFGYVDPDQQAEWDACADQSIDDLKEIARCALDTMPDVACSAIAGALGLKLHVVIGLSNGRHNKAKRKGVSKNIELSEVTASELIANYRAQLGA